MKGQVISVFLVAENRLLRESLTKLLGKKNGFKVCGSSSWVQGLSKVVTDSGADVLVLDSSTARTSECPLLAELASRCHPTKILLIDMEEDPECLLSAVREGAAGYLLKDASASEVLAGVRSVGNNQAVCPPQMIMTLFKNISQQIKPLTSGERIKDGLELTRRQVQLVSMVAQGNTNKEIACILNVSEQTVKNQLYRLMRRLGATSRLQIPTLTGRSGLLPQAYIS